MKMVLCSVCEGVNLKFKKKNGRASSLPAWIIWAFKGENLVSSLFQLGCHVARLVCRLAA